MPSHKSLFNDENLKKDSMRKKERLIYGLSIVMIIFAITIFIGSKIHIDSPVFPASFITSSLFLVLSVIAILIFRGSVNYKFSFPNISKLVKPVFITLIAVVLVNIISSVIIKSLGGNNQPHPALLEMSPLQVFIFVFFYASLAEEFLFRGFLLNLLKPFSKDSIRVLNRKLSISVLYSASIFALCHMSLITMGVDVFFLIRIFIFTMTVGVIAGYYQEKHDNNAYAILVHMTANSIAVLGAILMQVA